MKRKKNLFLGALLAAVTGFSTIAYALPQEIARILPIDAILSSITKNVDKKSDKSSKFNDVKQRKTDSSVSLAENSGEDISENGSKIPEQVVYLFLFRQVAAFEEKASEVESRGENGSDYRTVYKRLANLTDEQSEFLRNTAATCAAEVKIKDDEAKQIAEQLRAEYQAQLAAGNQAMPQPSAALAELQKQRDEIILKYRDLLETNFGEDFPRFESYLKQHITSNIKTDTRDKALAPPVNMSRTGETSQNRINPQPNQEDK